MAQSLCSRAATYRQFARRALIPLLLLLALTGCKTDLYTKQTENDANDMVAALLESGVQVNKATTDAGKTWNVQVAQDDVVRSLTVLRSYGLPRERHVTLGEMFKKEGLISTPTEERVRFIYGVAQQLEATLSQIDGVVTARVHIVLPNNDPLASAVKPASASVFIKYRESANLAGLVAGIKNMVARSVEGLSYENVTVTLVPGMPLSPAVLKEESNTPLWIGLGAALFLLLTAGGWLAWKRPAWLPEPLRRKATNASQPAADAAKANLPATTAAGASA
ncbi:type III secretion system inner membrane ring lipoprotein SctJ [Acidovorax sp. NCPPB 3576]|uniref:type III secretion system inner membrane ring lipoprotein SctJ n=1 Tax=Acidovorax sp. NCPPB 3576 TaxID=2940488 RepID=UPI002348F5D2|nr:type III secretion inner membrane ring lipoprotein SctJ [Acidovorax sp. NCPPB 3576]WCM87891.1 type III secretion inner membrane ring lipoprotein SctJ [Acidovorax sp. NCPPB 3576]